MSKQSMKGLSAFELLEGLDDELILSATLPEAAPAAAPAKGERAAAFFARMGRSGVAAAVISVAVALAVLTGMVLAGRMGTVNPPDTDPSHGIHGDPPHESGDLPDTSGGVIAPPLTETPEQEKGEVTLVSDGIAVYPKGYMVWASGQQKNDKGELQGFDADGMGASWRLQEIKDEIPKMRTAGNDYSLTLPAHMSLRDVRFFEIMSMENGGTFEQIDLPAGSEAAADVLKSLGRREGDYIVVLDIYSEVTYSEDEYVKSLNEYAFWLTVDSNMDITYPVRILIDGKTYYPEGNDGINSGYALTGMAPHLPTAVMTRETEWDFYLAPQGTLQSVTAYDGSFRLMTTEPDLEPLVSLPAWAEGDYYFVFTASFPFEGGSLTLEYPIHIRLVEEIEEETEEETYPNDVGETPEPPRVTVGTGFGSLGFGNTSHSSEYHEGYRLWSEEWYDGGMVSGDGPGATGQLADISAELPFIRHYMGETPTVRVVEASDTLARIYIYYEDHRFYADAEDASVLSTLPEGGYIVVLRVETQGDYIEEADAYERYCTEYAFRMDVVEEQAGIPGVPETNPRVIVRGGGQTAVFETEEDGFLAWTVSRPNIVISWMPRVEGTPAASVIFTDQEALRALPDMEIVYGTPLTLSLDAAGDELVKVTLYDSKGRLAAEGTDLSVVDALGNEGWDRGVILVLQILSRISETEQACYEYAIDLTITQP